MTSQRISALLLVSIFGLDIVRFQSAAPPCYHCLARSWVSVFLFQRVYIALETSSVLRDFYTTREN